MENFILALNKILDYLKKHQDISLKDFLETLNGYRKLEFADGNNSGMVDFVVSLKDYQPFAQLSLCEKLKLNDCIFLVCAHYMRARN